MITQAHALRLGLALLCSALLGGCYTTVVHSGKAASPAAIAYDDKWHHGFVYGIAEVSGPYDLRQVCPQGWAEIETETSFLSGLVDGLTGGIYSPQTVTVRCTGN